VISWKYSTWILLQPFALNWRLLNLVLIEWGAIGVSIFIFVSGCSLALNRNRIDTPGKVKSFYVDRMMRIYPVFWAACLFCLATVPDRLPQITTTEYVTNLMGFQAFGARSSSDFLGMINGAYWFIGVLICLYLLYPLLSLAIRRHPHLSIAVLLLVSLFSRVAMAYGFPWLYRGIDWFPLCQVFTFGLGIYIVQTSTYPKWTNTNGAMVFLGKLSFYIYLIHAPLLPLLLYNNIPMYIASTAIFACALYVFDSSLRRVTQSGLVKAGEWRKWERSSVGGNFNLRKKVAPATQVSFRALAAFFYHPKHGARLKPGDAATSADPNTS
jgi:peptidoglycan/LPS O-acetylase OafA/YrhL